MRFIAPLSLLYFAVLAIEVYAEIIEDIEMVWITKPLLMPILIMMFLANAKQNLPKERLFFTVALLFSLLGDVLLMFKMENLFVFGLAAFLVAHIAFIISFSGRIKASQVPIGQRLLAAIPFMVFVVGFMWYLYPYMASDANNAPLVIPVIVYASVIGMMGFTSVLRKKAVSNFGFWAVCLGALIFMASDSCIAINKFIFDGKLAFKGLIIMSTYGMAQYLMTVGTLHSHK